MQRLGEQERLVTWTRAVLRRQRKLHAFKNLGDEGGDV